MITSASSAGSFSTDRLHGFDFARHNEQVRATWDAFNRRRPMRVPIVLGANTRYFMFNRSCNPDGLTFRSYSENPDVMFDAALRFARWSRFNLLQDAELGLPDEWTIAPDFQNYYEAAWFGCPIVYFDDQVPDTHPVFADCPERIIENGPPDPFGGLMARALEYYEHFRHRAAHSDYLGRPIRVNIPNCGRATDGPLTVACNLFGPEFVFTVMVEEPQRLYTLMDFITSATIARMAAWRRLAGAPEVDGNFGFADDSCALVSIEMYRQHVLPHHRKLCDALSAPGSPRSVHLCGDATRLFRTMRDELNVQAFDTGFPVDFAQVRRELGPDVRINGGPHVELLLHASPRKVRDEVRRILGSGILEGGNFVLREGNNLAPYTPLENTEAMYHAGIEFGRLRP